METTLTSLSNDLAAACARVAGSVVGVDARRRFPSSGIVWRPGVVVTAAHAIRRTDEIAITLPDGARAAGSLAGLDRGSDIAILRCEAGSGKPPDLAPAGALRTAMLILAVGRAASAETVASFGAVSAVGEGFRTWRGGRIDSRIRLDVSLYPGLSGAAVAGPDGSVHGIATSGLSRFSALAIPVVTIDRVVDDILARGYVPHGYLGVGLQPVVIPDDLRRRIGTAPSRALIILSLETGGPADRAGLLIGDILLSIDGRTAAEIEDVHAALEAAGPGKTVQAKVVRGGTVAETAVTIGERPHGRS